MISFFRSICLIVILCLSLPLSSCFLLDTGANIERGDVLGFSFLSNNSSQNINLALQAAGTWGALAANYDVDSYQVDYVTVDVSGNLIKASGLLSVPKKLPGMLSPMLSYQHGTIFEHTAAPSLSATVIDKPVLLASLGFAVSSPDYLGFGSSSNIIHPYLHEQTIASATIDMARASKKLLKQLGISISNELFLMGYSEGGYATLATHKTMQREHANEFQVTASFPGAGPYDMKYTAQTLLANTLAYPAHIGFTFKAYDDIYQLGRIAEIFSPLYAGVVDTAFDGSKTGKAINALLTNNPQLLMQAPFLTNFLGGGELDYKAILDQNSLVAGWLPNNPVFLFHGAQDVIVPYGNATRVFNAMAGTGLVSLTSCAGVAVTGHAECDVPFAMFSLGVMMGMTGNL